MHMHKTIPWIHPVLVSLALIALFFGMMNFGSVKRALVGRADALT